MTQQKHAGSDGDGAVASAFPSTRFVFRALRSLPPP
jgi:hypothetical protein